jgi:hypothetical protein
MVSSCLQHKTSRKVDDYAMPRLANSMQTRIDKQLLYTKCTMLELIPCSVATRSGDVNGQLRARPCAATLLVRDKREMQNNKYLLTATTRHLHW